jgi:hypothetical protein
MATKTVSATGGNFSDSATWTVGPAPVTTDDVVFTSTSGPLIINSAYTVASINFTNYLNTITFNANLTVTGAINIGVGVGTGKYSTAGLYGLISNLSANTGAFTSTSSGTWDRAFTISGTYAATKTITVNGTFTFTNDVLFNFSVYNLTINSGSFVYNSNVSNSTNQVISGTTTFLFYGSGTLTAITGNPNGGYYTGQIRNPITINPSGSLIINNIAFNTNTVTYSSSRGGTVTHTGILAISANTTLNTSGMSWNNITLNGTTTITLTSALVVTTLNIGGSVNNQYTNSGSVTFAGSFGWTAGTFNIQSFTITNVYTLVSGITYNITSAFYCRRATASTGIQSLWIPNHMTLKSSTTSSSANLVLAQGSECILGFLNFTDINASGGREIRVFEATLLRTTNIRSYTKPLPVGG